MQRIYHYIRGTVRLRVTGPFPERCCNICANAGVAFWNVVRESEESCLLTVSLGDEHRVAELGRKALCQVEQVRVDGLPGILHRFRHRYGMVAGLVLVLLLFIVSGQFVLVIDVSGNETITRSEILSQLQSYGFQVGCYGPAVDERDLSNKMLLDFEELSYLSINISGIRAQVSVRERGPEPEVRDPEEIADVVAARDGVIEHISVVAGREQVQEGMAVLEGELLISHLVTHERTDGSGEIFGTAQVRAEGYIRAYTRRVLSAATPLTALVPAEETETVAGYGLEIMGKRLNFYQDSSNLDTVCDKIAILYPVVLPGGEELPAGLWEMTWKPWAAEPVGVNAESAERFLKQQLEERLKTMVGEEEILQMEWQVERTAEAVTVTLEAQCLEEIGKRVRLN